MFTHTTPVELPDIVATTKPSGRTYTTPDGNTYPSITTVLGSKEKPWLVNWQQSLGPSKAAKETKRCADRGTAVHNMAEAYLDNNQDPTKGYSTSDIKLFNQLRFKLNNIDNIRKQEAGLYSDSLRCAGRVDVIGEYQGELSIIDFKTANNNKDDEMVFDYFLQAAFYALAWYERTDVLIENLVILMAVERGMVPLEFTGNLHDFIVPLNKRIQQYHNDQSK